VKAPPQLKVQLDRTQPGVVIDASAFLYHTSVCSQLQNHSQHIQINSNYHHLMFDHILSSRHLDF